MIHIDKNKRIIISADDFGISKLANVKILDGVRRKVIDRVEVMVSENLSEEEIEELRNSGVKLDIHLHLIRHDSNYWQGDRRLKEQAAKRLVAFAFNYLTGRKSSDKVELQWAIQIEKFRELFGRNPDGIGSHEYIHFFPPYLKAVLNLAGRYGIPYIRLGKRFFPFENDVARILEWLRKKNIRRHWKDDKLETSDFMASFDWISDWESFIKDLPDESETEVVFHPEREEEFLFMEEKL